MKKVTKAVIPAAGLGTRMLPIARTVCKEMLPIVDRPAISYLAEEAAESGVTDLLIITNRGKGEIEDYFDYSPEYDSALRARGKDALADELKEAARMLNVCFIRQLEPKGLGHAVLRAKSFVGDEPFYVLYGDDIIFSDLKPVCVQLYEAYEKYGLPVCGMQRVDRELVRKYCTLDARPLGDDGRTYRIHTMIEKPTEEQIITDFSILGRVLLTPDVFPVLENLTPGAGGEYQLTDAMKIMSESTGFAGVDFVGQRYDMGSKLGFLKANVDRALRDPELGAEFAAWLKDKNNNL